MAGWHGRREDLWSALLLVGILLLSVGVLWAAGLLMNGARR